MSTLIGKWVEVKKPAVKEQPVKPTEAKKPVKKSKGE